MTHRAVRMMRRLALRAVDRGTEYRYRCAMSTHEVSAHHFRSHLKLEVDRVAENHDVLRVKRRNGSDFVVLSAEDWRAIEETLYLNHVPNLVESLHEADREPLEEGVPLAELDW